MDEQLLEELINDLEEIISQTTGETKQLAVHVRQQLKNIFTEGCE